MIATRTRLAIDAETDRLVLAAIEQAFFPDPWVGKYERTRWSGEAPLTVRNAERPVREFEVTEAEKAERVIRPAPTIAFQPFYVWPLVRADADE